MTDPELDRILHSAANEPPLPSDFQRQVWRRIESSSAPPAAFTLWFGKLFAPLNHPLGAVAFVLLTTFIGLGLGAGSVNQTEDWKEAYVLSVSPFASPHGQ